jgi:hypothetical protein
MYINIFNIFVNNILQKITIDKQHKLIIKVICFIQKFDVSQNQEWLLYVGHSKTWDVNDFEIITLIRLYK